MLKFLSKYRLLFLVFFPVSFVAGNAAGPASLLVLIGFYGYCVYIRRPDYIFLTFLLILILGDSRLPQLQYFKNLRVTMIILMSIQSYWLIRRGVINFSKFFIGILPFIAVATLAIIFSPWIQNAVLKTLSYMLFFFTMYHFSRHLIRTYGLILVRDVVMLLQLILWLGLIFVFLRPQIAFYLGGGRFNGLLGNPNGLGILVTLAVPLTYYYFKKDKEVPLSFKIAAYVAIFASVILCSSRNALFSITIFLTVAYGLQGGAFRRLIFILGILPATGLLVLNIPYDTLILKLGLEQYFRLDEFESGSGRTHAWAFALDVVKNNEVIGCGFACSQFNFKFRMPFHLWKTGHQGGVHNSYLQFLVDTGYLGILMFFLYLLNVFRHIEDWKIGFPFIVTALFSATFESWMVSSLNAFHVFFVFMLLLLLEDKHKKLMNIK